MADRRTPLSLAKLLRHAEASARLDAPRAAKAAPVEATSEERAAMGRWFLGALRAYGAKCRAEGRDPVIRIPLVSKRRWPTAEAAVADMERRAAANPHLVLVPVVRRHSREGVVPPTGRR